MKDLNWVVGVKRLYLILWGLWAVFIVTDTFKRGSAYGLLETLVGMFLICFAVPFAILKASQWIYAGMQSKQ